MADAHPVVTHSKRAKFDDVRHDLKLAIDARGLVIDYQCYLNRMLERTGRDVGSARKLYADAQAFVFCSAALSRKTMEADSANAALGPYSIMVYATAQDPRTVHVSYRRPRGCRVVRGIADHGRLMECARLVRHVGRARATPRASSPAGRPW